MNQDERARLTAERDEARRQLAERTEAWQIQVEYLRSSLAENVRARDIATDRYEAAETERDRLRDALRRAGETRAREPSKVGGPGHEETYWLRQKLNASVQHLRDVEDFYRLRGGSELSHNMVRADRARSLYEQITEDFVNGKLSRPTMRERAESAVAERDRLRDALRDCVIFAAKHTAENPAVPQDTIDDILRIARAALAESEEAT